MAEWPVCRCISMAMLFGRCILRPSLPCPSRCKSRLDRTGDGTKSAGRKLALRGLHPKRCTYRGARWQGTLSAVYTTEFHNSWNLYQDWIFYDSLSCEKLTSRM